MRIAGKILQYIIALLVFFTPSVIVWRSLVWDVSLPYRMLPIFGMALIGLGLIHLYYDYNRRVTTKNVIANAIQITHKKAAPIPDIISKTDIDPSVTKRKNTARPTKTKLSPKPIKRIYGRSFLKNLSTFVSICLYGAYHPIKSLSTKRKRYHTIVSFRH